MDRLLLEAPAMRTAPLLISLLCVGCDGPVPAEDGGPPPIPDAGIDGGPVVPAASAEFVATPTEGEGPWSLWGFMVVAIDASNAIVIGGTDVGGIGGAVYPDAWRVEVTPGAIRARRIDATGPAPLYCACAAYDPSRGVVVVFGGRDLDVSAFAPATWELDLATSAWTEIAGATQPTGTIGCAMAHAPGADAIYMFGGANGFGAYAQTHRYDGDRWTLLDAPGPVARYDGVLFESHDGEALLLFGGSYGARGAAFYSDLWRFDPSTESWAEILLPDGPVGRRAAWVVRDPERDGVYVGFGYDGEMMPLGDLFYLDLAAATWTPIEIPFEGPLPRGFSPSLPGGEGALGALFGGFGSSNPVVESWRLVRP